MNYTLYEMSMIAKDCGGTRFKLIFLEITNAGQLIILSNDEKSIKIDQSKTWTLTEIDEYFKKGA